jgi:hypothetical protein
MLIEARGGWVPSPELAALAQQFDSRLLELRRLNFRIENRVEERDGIRCSWFRLIPGSVQVEPARPPAAKLVDNPQTISPNVKSDPREQFQLFPPKDPR